MDPEVIVTLLEEHLKDMKQRFVTPLWQTFVNELEKYSENVAPKRNDLENWADKTSNLLSKYDYTKGLLQGLVFCTSLRRRGMLSAEEAVKDEETPETKSARISLGKTLEEDLVERIKEVAKRAKNLN